MGLIVAESFELMLGYDCKFFPAHKWTSRSSIFVSDSPCIRAIREANDEIIAKPAHRLANMARAS